MYDVECMHIYMQMCMCTHMRVVLKVATIAVIQTVIYKCIWNRI